MAGRSSTFAQRRLGACRLPRNNQQLKLSLNELEFSVEQFLFSASKRLFLHLLMHNRSVQVVFASPQFLYNQRCSAAKTGLQQHPLNRRHSYMASLKPAIFNSKSHVLITVPRHRATHYAGHTIEKKSVSSRQNCFSAVAQHIK